VLGSLAEAAASVFVSGLVVTATFLPFPLLLPPFSLPLAVSFLSSFAARLRAMFEVNIYRRSEENRGKLDLKSCEEVGVLDMKF